MDFFFSIGPINFKFGKLEFKNCLFWIYIIDNVVLHRYLQCLSIWVFKSTRLVMQTTPHHTTPHHTTPHHTTPQFSTVQYRTVHHSTVPYSTVQYSTVQYSTVQYSSVQYSTVHHTVLLIPSSSKDIDKVIASI